MEVVCRPGHYAARKIFNLITHESKANGVWKVRYYFLVVCIALSPLSKYNYMSIFLCSFTNIQLTLETFVTLLVEEEALIFMSIRDYIHFIIYV